MSKNYFFKLNFRGPDSMLVIWDVKTGIPRKTIFDPHPLGTECMDVSKDG